MNRRTLVLALSFGLVPVWTQAQGSAAVINKEGASPLATNPTFPASKTLQYKIAWGITTGPEKPGDLVEAFKQPANFLYVGDANGVPRANVHLAIVIWGNATHSLLKNDAYKAAKGADNASIPLLTALNDAGVQIIVCGEALINRKLDRADLLPFVKIAPTATYALATLHAQGYATWR